MGTYKLTIEELTLEILFRKRPKVGASLGTMLRTVTLGYCGDRMVSEEGTVEATEMAATAAMDTAHKK